MPIRRFAITDIHGCANTFKALLDRISLSHQDQLFLLGDYIDRGPHSREVLDVILRLRDEGHDVHCLLGNHEEMLFQAMEDYTAHQNWKRFNGGIDTLRSFRADNVLDIPRKYLDFIQGMKYYIELEDYLLVHAGFDFEDDDIFSDQKAMLWIRGFEVDPEKSGNRVVVHGHTPWPVQKIRYELGSAEWEYNIDNGCAYPREGMNGLVALNLDSLELTRVKNME